jgi:site-specific recombinase XerD
VKQHLSALRTLFDWLVTDHVLDVNPAHAVRGPKYVVKKGKLNEMPCHHKLEAWLDAYIDAAGIEGDRKGPLFRAAIGKTRKLGQGTMSRTDVWYMVRRRAADAGIETAIGCHTFRATGITDYLTNGGRIEVAQRMAGHSNAKTTGLYDRRNDDVSVGEVERIGI